jgi:hypothetical protein
LSTDNKNPNRSNAFCVTVSSLNGAPLSKEAVAKLTGIVDKDFQAVVEEHPRLVVSVVRT